MAFSEFRRLLELVLLPHCYIFTLEYNHFEHFLNDALTMELFTRIPIPIVKQIWLLPFIHYLYCFASS